MKKFFLSFAFFVFIISLSQAQEKLVFTYDDDGNQLERNYECAICLTITGSGNTVPDDLRAYPNPTNGILTIDWVGEYKDNKVYMVYVTSLNYTYTKVFLLFEYGSVESLTLDLTGQPAGIYIVNYFVQPGVTFSRKIIKL